MNTVTMTDIADLAGVKRPTVSNWRRRHESFPKPVGGSDTVPRFDAEDVVNWLRGRFLPEPHDGYVTYGDVFGSNLRVRGLSGGRGDDESIRSSVALTALRVRLRRPLNLDDVSEASPAVVQTVNELVSMRGGGAAVERLIETADRGTSTLWASATPPAVAELIAGVIGDVTGRSVCDPAAGVGDLLVRVLDGHVPASVTAFDVDPTALGTLENRLICHGVRAEISCLDSLTAWPAENADVVIVDPPFVSGDEQDRHDTLARWIDRAVAHTNPDGRAYVVVPVWWLSRRTLVLHEARQKLLARGCIAAVVQLPRRAHAFRTGTELAVLVLCAAGRAGGEIVLCDADRAARLEPGDWVQDCVAAVDGARNSGPHRRITAYELSDDRSWLPAHRLEARSVASLGAAIDAQRQVQQVFAEQFRVSGLDGVELRNTADRVRLTKVAAVLGGHRIATEHIRDRWADTGRSALIGSAELCRERPVGSRSIDNLQFGKYEAAQRTEPGDLIVLAEHGVRVLVDWTGGSVVLYPTQVVRPSSRKFPHGAVRDPMPSRVLARLLESPTATVRESGSLVRRVNLREVELPDLTDDEESRLDRFLAELESRRDQLSTRLAAVNQLERVVAAGVAGGVLRVVPLPDAPNAMIGAPTTTRTEEQ
jgi:predicted RNA methylase